MTPAVWGQLSQAPVPQEKSGFSLEKLQSNKAPC